MNKVIIAISAIAILCSCAGRERGVQDNMFYSSSIPKLNIKINPDFKYAESQSSSDRGTNPMAGDKMANVDVERYSFYNGDTNRSVEIIIQEITTNRWFWMPDHFRNTKNKIESGDTIVNGKNYKYCIAVQEISLGSCILSKMLGRNVTANSNCRILIMYNQNIRDYSICDGWMDSQLTESEKAYLNNFLADSENDFDILAYQAPSTVTTKPE
ncbi:hypothetical protein ACFL2E_11550 [Thermodesulfobacteriota bacterium]